MRTRPLSIVGALFSMPVANMKKGMAIRRLSGSGSDREMRRPAKCRATARWDERKGAAGSAVPGDATADDGAEGDGGYRSDRGEADPPARHLERRRCREQGDAAQG